MSADANEQADVAYWSIYTDLPGRVAFRKLYWDEVKDIIGRPATLVAIEREDDWTLKRPSRELRCHAYSYFRAASSSEAIADVVRRANMFGKPWLVFGADHFLDPDADIADLVWYRGLSPEDGLWAGFPESETRLPCLTSVMVNLSIDRGDRLRAGYTIRGRGHKERPTQVRRVASEAGVVAFTARWLVEIFAANETEMLGRCWTELQQKFDTGLVEIVDIEHPSGEGMPFRLRVRHALAETTEGEAIASYVRLAAEMVVVMETGGDGRFSLLSGRTRYPSSAKPFKSFELLPSYA